MGVAWISCDFCVYVGWYNITSCALGLLGFGFGVASAADSGLLGWVVRFLWVWATAKFVGAYGLGCFCGFEIMWVWCNMVFYGLSGFGSGVLGFICWLTASGYRFWFVFRFVCF